MNPNFVMLCVLIGFAGFVGGKRYRPRTEGDNLTKEINMETVNMCEDIGDREEGGIRKKPQPISFARRCELQKVAAQFVQHLNEQVKTHEHYLFFRMVDNLIKER
jgi:hypothetical protein